MYLLTLYTFSLKSAVHFLTLHKQFSNLSTIFKRNVYFFRGWLRSAVDGSLLFPSPLFSSIYPFLLFLCSIESLWSAITTIHLSLHRLFIAQSARWSTDYRYISSAVRIVHVYNLHIRVRGLVRATCNTCNVYTCHGFFSDKAYHCVAGQLMPYLLSKD